MLGVSKLDSVGWATGDVEMIAQSVRRPATYIAAMAKMMWNQEYYTRVRKSKSGYL